MSETVARVLVVDDEPDLADLYATWLGDRYAVSVASDGQSALESLDDDVDVLLLDRQMPRLSGDEVVAALDDRELDCLVAMVTSVRPDFDVLGFEIDDYRTKPIGRDELVGLVEGLLDRKQYDSTMNELFSLLSKRAALRSDRAERELRLCDAYRELTDRIHRLEADADEFVRQLSDAQLESLLRHIGQASRGQCCD